MTKLEFCNGDITLRTNVWISVPVIEETYDKTSGMWIAVLYGSETWPRLKEVKRLEEKVKDVLDSTKQLRKYWNLYKKKERC